MTYSKDFLEEINSKVKKALKTKRYIHTQGVRYTAGAMAMKHGLDINTAMLAGILHDCAKNTDVSDMKKICKKNGLELSDAERNNPELIHAKAGMLLAKNLYNIDDSEILEAIRYHTTGKADMTLLEKTIFIADFIEPGRDKAECLPEARKAAFEDIDECMYIILKNTLDYLSKSNNSGIDNTSKEAYIFYKQIHDDKCNI